MHYFDLFAFHIPFFLAYALYTSAQTHAAHVYFGINVRRLCASRDLFS